MKSPFLKTIAVSLLLLLPFFAKAQTMSTSDSIHFFYDQLFEQLEANYLYKHDVDWEGIKPYIKKEALKAATFEVALELCPTVFDTIKGDHVILFTENNMYKGTLERVLTKEDFHPSFLQLMEKQPSFEVKVLEDNYGYVFIPGMLMLDATKQELEERAQLIYDAILDANEDRDIKGWIIDLRYNIGGNANVMIAGLYHLLGDNTTYLFLDVDKNLKTWTGFDQGTFYHNNEVMIETKIRSKPNTEVPVALITSVTTASAGEDVVLAFRGRKNIVVVGEESYGYTTANDLFDLPFGNTIAITLSYATDRTAKYTKTIVPDIAIVKEANFEDLTKDKNIMEAIKFINARY